MAGKTELNQIEALLRLSERLEHSTSADLLLRHLRMFPTLDSPALSHDPATMHRLRKLLHQSPNLTLLSGGNSTDRTFLITALANAYLQEGNPSRSVVGWDLHTASWFVPLPGVQYLPDDVSEPHTLRAPGVPLQLIVSNGLWERFSRHRAHLMNCALTNHVIVADGLNGQRWRREVENTQIRLSCVEIVGDSHRLQVTLITHSQSS